MNKQGKTRLSKWYLPPPSDNERLKMESEIHRMIAFREKKHTNFVEFENFKIIYRRYAGLYFAFGNQLFHIDNHIELYVMFIRNRC
jgi:AP-2 complex subunit sigma-1